MPTRTGPCPGKPVIDIKPPIPCAIWSKPGRDGIGAGLPETGNAGIDQLGIDLAQLRIVDAETALHVGPKILHHDVGLFHHALEGRHRFRRLQVERHAALVAVQVLKIRPFARAAQRFTAARVGR